MTPELQKLFDAQMQNVQQAQLHANLLAYSTYAAILICALFSVLIFWKLCQIQKLLAVARPAHLPENPAWQNEFATPATPVAAAESDDERFKPKS